MMRGRRVLPLLLFALAACSFTRAEPLPPTATTVRVVAQVVATPVPTVSRPIEAQPAQTTPTPDRCHATAGQNGAQYDVTAQVNYAARTAQVAQRAHILNRTNEPLTELVFNVEPNRWPNAFTLDSLAGAAAYELTGRRLTVELAQPLQPGCALDLDLSFRLAVPPIGTGVNGYSGYFGFSPRQLNLGHWLPTLAVRRAGDWITYDVFPVGEQVVAEVADWALTLDVTGGIDGIRLAAPGMVEQRSATQWHIVHEDAREVTLSLSYAFNVASQRAENGVMVELYSFEDARVQTDQGVVDGAAHALNDAARALAMYSDLFGAYPYERFVVVQGDFPDGMEFSDLVFVSSDWFRSFSGDPGSYLTIITVHEVAHQWWYARVGSDPAQTPWMDEALATYSEYIFFEEYYPDLREWWWSYRVDTFAPPGFTGRAVNSSIYEFASIREYINAVYLRGARMLHALREDLGTEAFFAWLRRYAEAGAGRVVTPDVFWSLLTPEEQALTQATRAAFIGQ